MLEIFEVLVILFLIVMGYITFVSYKRKNLSKLSFAFWELVWLVGLLGTYFNNHLEKYAQSIHIMRIFDLYTIIGFMFFLFIIFYLFKIVKKSEKRIEELTRVIALKSLSGEKSKK
jgi:hypothetical protein